MVPEIMNLNPTLSENINSTRHYRDQVAVFCSNLHKKNYHFFATFRSRPVPCRKSFEGLLNEWYKRLNRKLVGRNWSKNTHAERRAKGVVFFEKYPDLHAHALICPPQTIHQVSTNELIQNMKDIWGFDLTKFEVESGITSSMRITQRMLINSINPGGHCFVKPLNTPEDGKGSGSYSMKQAHIDNLMGNDDFKFLDQLESAYPKTCMNPIADLRFRHRTSKKKNQRHPLNENT